MGALISVIISVLLMLTGCESTPKQAQSGELSVHFIDVGQGDCTLVMMPDGKNMLIDAGNKENSHDITDYLSANGVKKIDYARRYPPPRRGTHGFKTSRCRRTENRFARQHCDNI